MVRSLIASLASLFMVTATATAAFADGSTPTTVSLEDLKAKCADLLANPQMVKPKVKVTCNELTQYWAPSQAKPASLPNSRKVGALVQMKGFEVGHTFFDIPIDATAIQCASFTKIERQVHNIDTELSCEQLADIKDLGGFCAPLLTSRASQDPALVEEHPTNETITLCPQR